MNQTLNNILENVIHIAKQTESILGAWYFGSIKHKIADEHSDVDLVFLVKGDAFQELEKQVPVILEKVCDNVLLCFEEDFNGEAIVNNGYLLQRDGQTVQFDVFLLNQDKLDDFMCRMHYADLSEEDIVFDRNGEVKKLCGQVSGSAFWGGDVQHLAQSYWYHFYMTAKYLLRRDYFKLYQVMHTLYEIHASLLLTAYDQITWGGMANKLHFIPEEKQAHLRKYSCTEDFARNREYLQQAAQWFLEDYETIRSENDHTQDGQKMEWDAGAGEEVLNYWKSVLDL